MSISLDDFKSAVPKTLQGSVTQSLVDSINNIAIEPDTAKDFREKVLEHCDVLGQGRYKLQDYLHACLFTSYKMMDYSNVDAWAKVFPKRHQSMIAQGKSNKDISATASMYSKGKLVVSVLQRSLTKTSIMYADVFHKAIKKQVALMACGHVQTEQKASECLIRELKPTEELESKIELEVKSDSVLEGLTNALDALAKQSREKVIDGTVTSKDLALRTLEVPDGTTE